MLEATPDAPTLADLIQTVSVYTGELLPAFYDEWVLLERERLRALFERRMQDVIDGLVAAERWREVTWRAWRASIGAAVRPWKRSLVWFHRRKRRHCITACQLEKCRRFRQRNAYRQ